MMAASSYDHNVAVEAAEENYRLRKRLARMDREEEQQRRAAEYESRFEESLDTSANDRIRRKNEALQEEIANFESQLRELKAINVTDLQHQFTRLDNRRAHLLNEVTGLRRILANQSKDVKRVTRTVNDQHEIRRLNREQHASLNADIQLFREKRESLAKETQRFISKEHHLMRELETLPGPGEDQDVIARRLREDNDKKDHIIERLEAALRAQQLKGNIPEPEATPADDMERLREEYVRLNDQLKRCRQ